MTLNAELVHNIVQIALGCVCMALPTSQFDSFQGVVHFAIFEKLTITSRTLKIQMEHIEIKNRIKSQLQSGIICSIRILPLNAKNLL